MVTEVLLWALIVTNAHKGPQVIEVYDNERLCRQDMREAAIAVREAKLKCVPKYSPERPGYEGSVQQ
jgi:hypothetical protein